MQIYHILPRQYSNNLCWHIITHNDYTHITFRFQDRLSSVTTFFEIAVCVTNVAGNVNDCCKQHDRLRKEDGHRWRALVHYFTTKGVY